MALSLLLALAHMIGSDAFASAPVDTTGVLMAIPIVAAHWWIVLAAAFSALVVGGYAAARVGGGPSVPLAVSASLVLAGLLVRSAIRHPSEQRSMLVIALLAGMVASAALGGYLRHRQLISRGSGARLIR